MPFSLHLNFRFVGGFAFLAIEATGALFTRCENRLYNTRTGEDATHYMYKYIPTYTHLHRRHGSIGPQEVVLQSPSSRSVKTSLHYIKSGLLAT